MVHDDIVLHSWNESFVVVNDDENAAAAAAARDGGASTRAVALHAAM